MPQSEASIHIVKADLRHLAEISRIERENFPDPWSDALFRERLADPRTLFSVAEGEGRVRGYSVLQLIPPEAELHNIAVERTGRRRGLGRALLRAALEAGRSRGVETVYLEVRASNAPAIGLYRSMGFLPIGIRRGYYLQPREDAVLMACRYPHRESETSV